MATEKIVIFNEDERGIARSWSEVGEIVRCKDCKHHDGIRCFRWNSVIVTGFDDFCSEGERSEDGEIR